MKLHSEQREVTRGGIGTEHQFSIKGTAKAFGILSSGLYSDKILAIIRELSCNAYDAHVAAGNRETPIEIKLPTSLDPTFYVKDYGVGLDHKGVTQLYTTYFESSKADSDEFIGALGLGSKSPFSYVSTFNVESRHNGMRRLYNAFINEHGVPSITLLGEEKSKEPNGLTVSLATKTADADKFRGAACKSLMYFDVQPKVVGGGAHFKPYSIKHTVSGSGWKLREADYYSHMEGAYVVQGMVAYPVDEEILSQHGLSDVGVMILNQNIDLFVPIGAVEVAASREALSYTKKTIENLIKIVDAATKEMRDSIQTEIDKMPSLWDACLLHATYSSRDNKMYRLYIELQAQKPFKYKGKEVTDSINLDMKAIVHTQMTVANVSRYNRGGVKVRTGGSWEPGTGPEKFSFSVHAGMKVLVDDTSGGKAMLKAYFEDANNLTKDDDTYVLVIKGLSKKIYSATEVDKLLGMFGMTNPVRASNLTYTITKQKYNYRARKMNEALLWDGYPENGGYRKNQIRRVFSRLCWISTQVDLAKEKGFYVPIERFTIMKGPNEAGAFDIFLNAMVGVGIFQKGVKVIGLNDKQLALIKKNTNWKNIFDYAEQEFAKLNAQGELTNAMVGNRLISVLGEGVRRSIVDGWDQIEPMLVDGTFKEAFTSVVQYNKACRTVKFASQVIEAAVANLPGASKFNTAVKDGYDTVTLKFNNAMKKHAMLGLVDWTKVSGKSVDMIVEYVNFVAKS